MKPTQANRHRELRANLWKLYVFHGVKSALLAIAILVPFQQEAGLSLRDVFWLQGLFGLAVMAFEVPSGYFSDLLGRRRTLFVGSIFTTLGMAVYPLGEGFYGFLLAELLLGIGFSFFSGTTTALTWESLEELGEVDDYRRVLGRQRFIMNSSEAVASIVGGALAVLSLRLPLLVDAFIYPLLIPLALSLVEARHRDDERKAPPSIPKILRETFRLRPELRQLILLAAFVAVSTLAMAWYTQPWFENAGIPLAWFGLLWAVLRLSSGFSSLLAHRVVSVLGGVNTIRLMIGLIGVAYGLVAVFNHPAAFPALLLFGVIRGLGVVVFSEALNRRIPSDRRATVLSVQHLVARLIFCPLSPLLGWMADVWRLETALAFTGLFFAIGAGILYGAWLTVAPGGDRTDLLETTSGVVP